jgi:hypothetical protein
LRSLGLFFVTVRHFTPINVALVFVGAFFLIVIILTAVGIATADFILVTVSLYFTTLHANDCTFTYPGKGHRGEGGRGSTG